MRTSPSQFKVLVAFMESNGDLNKPADGPYGRIMALNKWEELINILNLDTTGPRNTMSKWKKVWSDLKNNTKKKASKIEQSARATVLRPACQLTLTDLEQRVLSLTSSQAENRSVDLNDVKETDDTLMELDDPLKLLAPIEEQETLEHESKPIPTSEKVQVELEVLEGWSLPSQSGQSASVPLEAAVASSSRHHPNEEAQWSSARAPRRRRCRAAPPPRGRRPRDNSEQRCWRTIMTGIATEHLRLREKELQQQAQWQALFEKCLVLLEKFI